MKILIVLLAIIFLGLQVRLLMGNGSIVQVGHLRLEVATQQAAVKQLKIRNQTLDAEVNDLKHHLGALEERARTDLGMIKHNESFFQFAQQSDG